MEAIDREQFTADLIQRIASGKEKLSYSSLSKFRESPKSFIDYKLKPKKSTPSQELGKIVHCLILEPERASERYISDAEIYQELIDDGAKSPRGTAKYKAWVADQTAEIVDIDTYAKARMMAASVLNNPVARKYLDRATSKEVKFEFEHEGLRFVGFYDGIDEEGYSLIIDVKTCADANPDKFRRDIVNNGYWFQSGTYCFPSGMPIPYYLIAIDNDGGVSVNQVAEDLVEYGMEVFDRTVKDFKRCMERNLFHQSYEYRSVSPDGTFICSRPPYLT